MFLFSGKFGNRLFVNSIENEIKSFIHCSKKTELRPLFFRFYYFNPLQVVRTVAQPMTRNIAFLTNIRSWRWSNISLWTIVNEMIYKGGEQKANWHFPSSTNLLLLDICDKRSHWEVDQISDRVWLDKIPQCDLLGRIARKCTRERFFCHVCFDEDNCAHNDLLKRTQTIRIVQQWVGSTLFFFLPG